MSMTGSSRKVTKMQRVSHYKGWELWLDMEYLGGHEAVAKLLKVHPETMRRWGSKPWLPLLTSLAMSALKADTKVTEESIVSLRASVGLSQIQAADLLDISISTYQAWEYKRPGYVQMLALTYAFGEVK